MKKNNDDKQCELLEKFINDSPSAESIKVKVNTFRKSFIPRYKGAKAYYEDANLLSAILMGAENFCYWLRRNNYKIIKVNSKNESKNKK